MEQWVEKLPANQANTRSHFDGTASALQRYTCDNESIANLDNNTQIVTFAILGCTYLTCCKNLTCDSILKTTQSI